MQKNLRKSLCYSLLCIGISLFFAGCTQNISDLTSPQFAISQPVYKSNEENNHCQIGGVYFDFYNKAEVCVTHLEIRMNVYDRGTGKNAFTGCGSIISQNDLIIKSGEKRQLCVSLDKYITVVSRNGYFIDQFYVSLIEYEDGRVWKDSFGLYATSSGE